jgi:ribonucleoside-diphosphate reductase alpha chain
MRRLRNCNLTTVAPTGTIDHLGCSSGTTPLPPSPSWNQAGVLMPDVNEDFVAMRSAGWYWKT